MIEACCLLLSLLPAFHQGRLCCQLTFRLSLIDQVQQESLSNRRIHCVRNWTADSPLQRHWKYRFLDYRGTQRKDWPARQAVLQKLEAKAASSELLYEPVPARPDMRR